MIPHLKSNFAHFLAIINKKVQVKWLSNLVDVTEVGI